MSLGYAFARVDQEVTRTTASMATSNALLSHARKRADSRGKGAVRAQRSFNAHEA
jgi:hypothetical protein